MSQSSDLDPLKEIPGYKAILKSVLKSQIQLLIEQLADHTGEESIILTASINDGTLSHLGSNTGKGFLEGRDEMKSQFLGYCLKTHHRKKQAAEPKTPSYQRSNQRHMPYRPPPKHDRLHPISLQRTRPAEDTGVGLTDSRIPDLVSDNSGNDYVKQEGSDLNQSTAATFPDSLQLSHTQTLGDLENSGQGNGVSQGQIQGQTSESGEQDSEDANNDSSANIKIEPITENEMELEITGVEPGNVSLGQDDWGQGQPGYTTAGAEGDGSLSQGADASNYNFSSSGQEMYGYEVEYVWSEHISTGREVNSQLGIKKSTRKRPKNCACSICGKLFTWPVEVRRHGRIHTGERPYICNICGKGFTRKFTMENHMLVHEIQQNFQKT